MDTSFTNLSSVTEMFQPFEAMAVDRENNAQRAMKKYIRSYFLKVVTAVFFLALVCIQVYLIMTLHSLEIKVKHNTEHRKQKADGPFELPSRTFHEKLQQEKPTSEERDAQNIAETSEIENSHEAINDELTNLTASLRLQKGLSRDLQQAITKLGTELTILRGKQNDFEQSTEKKCSLNMSNNDGERQHSLEDIDASDQIQNANFGISLIKSICLDTIKNSGSRMPSHNTSIGIASSMIRSIHELERLKFSVDGKLWHLFCHKIYILPLLLFVYSHIITYIFSSSAKNLPYISSERCYRIWKLHD